MEIGNIALGFMMLTLGLGSASLAALYWRSGGLTLLSFGLFSLLFSIRFLLSAPAVAALVPLPPTALLHILSTAYYWIPVPFLAFLEQVLEPAARPLFRRLRQGWCVLALACMAHDLVTSPGASTFVYQSFFLVALVAVTLARLAWRGVRGPREQQILTTGFIVFLLGSLHDIVGGMVLLPWDVGFVNPGLTVFLVCLGYVTAQQFFSAQRELAAMEYELHTARAIQSSLLPHGTPPVPAVEVAVRYEPMRQVGGDMYDFALDGRRIGLLVADVTGHGLPAALIASMAKVAFASQAMEVARPGHLIAGMNRALSGHAEGRFVTATYLHIDPASQLVRYANAGHPPPLLWRRAARQVVELADSGLLMGLDPNASYATGEARIGPGDRLVVYTDGVIEAADSHGEFLGIEGLRAFVKRQAALGPEAFADALLAHLRERTGHGRHDPGFDDDVTLAVVDVCD